MSFIEQTLFASFMVALGWYARPLYFRFVVLRRVHHSWDNWDEQEVDRELKAAARAEPVSVHELIDTADELYQKARLYVEWLVPGGTVAPQLADLIDATAKYMALEKRRDTMRAEQRFS